MSGRRDFSWRWLGLGLLAGAAGTGGLVTLLGQATAVLPSWRVLALLAVSACLGLWDIAGGRAVTFPWRQTHSGATSHAGPRVGLLALGFDVGLGFTTYRTSRIYWIGLLMLMAGSPAAVCLAGSIGYIGVLLWSVRKGGDLVVPAQWVMRRRHVLGIIGGTVPAALIVVITGVG